MWQPIETAPRDGTEFIAAVWWDDTKEWEVRPMKWHEWKEPPQFGREYSPYNEEQPRRWQPMPTPPTDQLS